MPDGDPRQYQVAAPVRTGKYQKYADAILRGCKLSGHSRGELVDERGNTCAIGAMFLGLGMLEEHQQHPWKDAAARQMCSDYEARYKAAPAEDNDLNFLTREQIAERIAAL